MTYFCWVLPKHGFPLKRWIDHWPTVTGLKHSALRQDPWMHSDIWFWRVAWRQKSLLARMFGWTMNMINQWSEGNLGMHCFIFSWLINLEHILRYTSDTFLACNAALILTFDLISLEATSHLKHLVMIDGRAPWNSWWMTAVDERHLPMDTDGYGAFPETNSKNTWK